MNIVSPQVTMGFLYLYKDRETILWLADIFPLFLIQMVQKMKRELRQKIESEIRELQECLINEEDVAHFRELDAQNVRRKLSRMTFTTTVK